MADQMGSAGLDRACGKPTMIASRTPFRQHVNSLLKAFSREIRPMEIRRYDAKDAVFLADLFVRSVKTIGSRDYSSLQVDAWLSLRPSPERLHQLSADGRTRLVAVDDSGQPIAFADLETDGHIGFLYCSPEVTGTGVASALYDEMEGIAREQGLIRLHSEASEAARRLFLKKGFVVTARRQFEISGVPIHNYAVEKVLGEKVLGNKETRSACRGKP